MRGVVGEINSTVLLSFNLSFIDGPALSHKQILLKGSGVVQKGYFMSLDSDEVASGVCLEYVDYLNRVTIRLDENKAYPRVKIFTSLPNPDKLEVSEFFIEGYFAFHIVNIPSQKKSVAGETINKAIEAGKKINILDRLYIQRIGDPLVLTSVIETDIGNIIQYRSISNIEI